MSIINYMTISIFKLEKLFSSLHIFLYNLYWDRFRLPLYKISLPHKIIRLRNKQIINTIFIIEELGTWKTENLYKLMLSNSRFSPLLVIPHFTDSKEEKTKQITSYLDKNKYHYVVLKDKEKINDIVLADIIFYQKPYEYGMRTPGECGLNNNLNALFCYVRYAFNTINKGEEVKRLYNLRLYNCAWQIYYENEASLNGLEFVIDNHARNSVITGIPIMDILSQKDFPNPWKQQTTSKKKIIWAPHHSIPSDNNILHYSTFLQYHNYMLTIADKYKESIQFSFKPHPLLKDNLKKIWSEKKIENYFNEWNNRDNTQIIEGDYWGLFFHSDAMIHDCGSFTIEYLFSNKPVAYLENSPNHSDNMNDFGKNAYDLHFKIHNEKEIDRFIINVLNGKDSVKSKRELFIQQYLTPPHNKTASQNIINAILGVEEYKLC